MFSVHTTLEELENATTNSLNALLRVLVNKSYDYQRIFRSEALRSNFSGLKSVFPFRFPSGIVWTVGLTAAEITLLV